MVRTKNSCFKIMTCASNAKDEDDFDDEPTESKGLMDNKSRWSFRKRSTRHRVLSNTVISESPSSRQKESPESINTDLHAQSNSTIPEKVSVSQWKGEAVSLLATTNVKVADPITATENTGKSDSPDSPFVATQSSDKIDSLTTAKKAIKIDNELEESAATVIQAAIREYLAQRRLLKLKNVVKLQAAVRGHLVRRQAVGTLRCVQAIVKMQTLVRARRARLSVQGLLTEEKIGGRRENDSWSEKNLEKENSGVIANRNQSATQKLLGNGFARQLLESTPTTKQINVRCDPSRSDSVWKWLERWMSVTSESVQAQQPLGSSEKGEQGEMIGNTTELGKKIPDEGASNPVIVESTLTESAMPVEGEENLITYDADNFKFQACCPTSSTRDGMQQPHQDDVGVSKAHRTYSATDTSQTKIQPDAASCKLPVSVSSKSENENEQPRRSMKRMAPELPETEGKKFVLGSRKTCNPAFTAVQSKFKELSSSTISGKSNNSVAGVESKPDGISSTATSLTRTKEHSLAENLVSHESGLQVGGSECGTELSISSTLDSPDRSEVGREDHETVPHRGSSESNGAATSTPVLENIDVVAKTISFNADSKLFVDIPSQQGKLGNVKGEPVVAAESSLSKQQPGRSSSDMQNQLETRTEYKTYRSSPEGSPRSHITVPESHGTPSSQVSVKDKRSKTHNGGSGQKRKSLSAGKRSPSNPSYDSGARSSTEMLPKDSKNGKRRSSFGSTRHDPVEQESRDNSSSSLPSYMQATKSARAKAYANNSPRSSPDVQDKDINVKKRHSLPGASGKQVSPRMQRSMSQVQQSAKGNGAHERKWQR